jgi:hypothetical protein
MNGSLIWLSLRCTRHHRIGHLSLHFHTTSKMMPHAPPIVAPLLVLRQNWETLALPASRRSKPLDFNACPHTIFIRSSVLRRKPTSSSHLVLKVKSRNCHDDFEAQIKKMSWWFWGPNHQTIVTGFEAKPRNPRFSSPTCVRCQSHIASPDLSIIQPPSTRLVPDHHRSSTPSLLLLPRSSSLPTMSHSPPTHHETSKHVCPHRITQYRLVQPKCTEFKFKLEQVNYSSHI